MVRVTELIGVVLLLLLPLPVFGAYSLNLTTPGNLGAIPVPVNPLLQRRIDWVWFVLSQIAFGVVAGFVVSRQERIRTWQAVPLAVRMGVESPGIIAEKSGQQGP